MTCSRTGTILSARSTKYTSDLEATQTLSRGPGTVTRTLAHGIHLPAVEDDTKVVRPTADTDGAVLDESRRMTGAAGRESRCMALRQSGSNFRTSTFLLADLSFQGVKE